MTPTQRLERIFQSQQSGYTEPAELVIRDRAGWEGVWRTVHQGLAPPPLPEVDFAREMVVIVALGERASGGIQVTVDDLSHGAGGSAAVTYTVREPGAGCLTTQATTSPLDVVRAPRAAGDVSFERRTVRVPC